MANKDLTKAKEAKKDEFYTQLEDINNELKHYREHFRGKNRYLFIKNLNISKVIIAIIGFVFITVSCTGKDPKATSTSTYKTPLDLFYGMSDWYDHKTVYKDSVLDTISGLLHQEFYTDLCIPEDSVRYRNSLGVYIDEEYPTPEVRENVFAFADSLICQGLSYNIEENSLSHDLSPIDSASDFLNIWKGFYDNMGKVDEDIPPYPVVTGTRVCVVSHKVYEKDDFATYIMQSSVDYHGSNGCPSESDYITYNISSGKPLSINEVLKSYPVSNLNEKLREAYVNAAKERNFEPSDSMTGEKLIQEAHGAAIINEGVVIYYKPYKIGCGAEGQYNLVIN